MNKLIGLPTATQVPIALQRKLEDLGNELAYIDQYPERWDSQEARAVRRVAVIQLLAEVRRQLTGGYWAMPVELDSPSSTEAA